MRWLRTLGSVRGAFGNGRPYRDLSRHLTILPNVSLQQGFSKCPMVDEQGVIPYMAPVCPECAAEHASGWSCKRLKSASNITRVTPQRATIA